jgi:hypothetical protein
MARKLPKRQTAARYGVLPRSIERWSADPKIGFPSPIKIGKRDYYDEDELDSFDKKRAQSRSVKA